jgi:hypothetical protein
MTRSQDNASTGNRAGTASTAATNGHGVGHDPFLEGPTVNDAADDGATDMNGRRPEDPEYNPWNTKDANEKHRQRREAEEATQAMTEERLKKFGSRRYALTTLDGRNDGWARKLAAHMERKNAGREPTKAAPELIFSGADAVNAGATDAQLTALPALSNDEIAALQIRAAALHEHCRTQIRMQAKALATPRQPLREVIRRVADMVNDPPAGAVVEGLLYEETVVSWVGDGGTYKTFTVLSLACSVAAGRDFTGQLRVPQKHPALFLCAERRRHGLIGDVQAWCAVNKVDIGTLDVHGWDDVVQLGDEEWMAELTDYVIEHGIKVIVFDTQRKATRGLEENSSTDMGAALANAQALARRAKAVVIIIHHTARGQNHGRGSTVMFDDTDVTLRQNITGPSEAEFVVDKHKSEPTGTRYPVKVKTVTVAGAPVTLDEGNGNSTVTPGESFTTLAACPRDPLTGDETAEKMKAALDPNDKVLVAVVNDNTDGTPLSPAEVHRRAAARGYTLKEDATRDHLRMLARPGYALVAETVSPTSHRRTYAPKRPENPPEPPHRDS